MSDTSADLRSYLLTEQEARTVFAALDFTASVLVSLGDEIESAVALRDRFRTEDAA